MTAGELQVVARGPDEGEALWVLGGLYTYRALPAETGAYLLVEVDGPRGLAAPLHFHEGEDEGFYVRSGRVRMVIGDRTIEATAGSFLLAPRGVHHAFVFASGDASLLLLLSGGSGHEELFRAIGEPAGRREVPPPASKSPDFERLAATAAKHGTRVVGPAPS
jgi:mannose-6-phosphate isomerase-like protein (cupin superfamily)